MIVLLKKSTRKDKKYMVEYIYKGIKYMVHFGGIKQNGKPYEDYTIHKDPKRKKLYIDRHSKESNRWIHKKENLKYPSYLSRWLLWNKPTLKDSINDIENKLKIIIKYV